MIEEEKHPLHENLEVDSDIGDAVMSLPYGGGTGGKEISTSEMSETMIHEYRLDQIREVIKNQAIVCHEAVRVQSENAQNITSLTKAQNDLTRSVIELSGLLRDLTIQVGKMTGERSTRSATPTRKSSMLSKTDTFIPRPHTSAGVKR